MKWYDKYIVIKSDDCDQYLSDFERLILTNILAILQTGRKQDGKKINSYLVINTDEPYAWSVRRLIEQSEDEKTYRYMGRTNESSGAN